MIRATTPTHTFTFDSDPSVYSRILVTYSQNNKVVLEKEKADLTIEERQTTSGTEYVAWFRLTQEEANRFASKGSYAKVQVRVLTTAALFKAYKALNREQFRGDDECTD